MANSTKQNTERVSKLVKPLVSDDWTKNKSGVPFYDYGSSNYSVVIDTGVINFPDLTDSKKATAKSDGVQKILNFYNKQQSIPPIAGSIPPQTSGIYVPLRPIEEIKVLVQVPAIVVDELQDKHSVNIVPYDEVQLNSFRMQERVKKVVGLLEKFDKEAKDFDGRVYNVDLSQQATKVKTFASALSKLVDDNGYTFSDLQPDLLMIGASSEYVPLYAQMNQGDGFFDLSVGFNQFRESEYVDQNTMFIYKNLDDIVRISEQLPFADKNHPDGRSSMDWQQFLETYIKFPPAIIENSKPRWNPPPEGITGEMKREIEKANDITIKTPDDVEKENARIVNSKHFKKKMNDYRKQSKDFIGDNVLGNIDKTINQINKVDDLYSFYLNKLGIRDLVNAAMKCLEVDLPIEGAKAFLLDARNFTRDVVKLLQPPVCWLDEVIPTVDMMEDILKQVMKSILNAVLLALWGMLKKILLTLLEACGDPCKANFGGVQIGDLLSQGGLGAMAKGLVAPMGQVVGEAALKGASEGLRSSDLGDNSRKFLNNLNSRVSDEQMDKLLAPVKPIVSGPLAAAGASIEGALQSPLNQVLDSLSANLTCGETNKLLQGNPTPETVDIVKAVCKNLDDDAFAPLCGLLGDEEKIRDFFGSLGKVADVDNILTPFEDIYPDETLCDEDDMAMRCQLLQDKGVPDGWCEEQIRGSRERTKKQIDDLAKVLGSSDVMGDVLPPVYCTYDKENNKVIPGLISNDHPSFTFMMDAMLNTTFLGIQSAFSNDVVRVPDLLTKEVPDGVDIIPRVIEVGRGRKGAVEINNSYYVINPEFEMAVQQGYKPDPEYWKSVPWNEPDLKDGKPTDPKTNSDALMNAHKRTVKWNKEQKELEKPKTKTELIPGLKNSYDNFQTSILPMRIDVERNKEAKERLGFVDNKVLQVSAENQLKTDLQKYSQGHNLMEGVLKAIMEKGGDLPTSIIGVDRYSVLYKTFSQSKSTKDKFSVTISADNSKISNIPFNLDISEPVKHVIGDYHLFGDYALFSRADVLTENDHSIVENRFADYLTKTWTEGERIYVDGEKLVGDDKPGYLGGISMSDGNSVSDLQSAILENQSEALDVKSLYQELFRDLLAQCLTEVGKSPLLERNIFKLMDFVPKPRSGCRDPGLLAIESTKAAVKEMYKDVQCIEQSLPNVTGLGSNKDNALEQSGLYGVVRLTARVYAIEFVLKTLMTFTELNVQDVIADDVVVTYLREHMVGEIKAKYYLDPFMDQCLKSYNATALMSNDPNFTTVTDPAQALDWFIRQELEYAVTKLLAFSGQNNNASLSDKLLDDWIPEFEAGTLQQGEHRYLDEYKVGNVQDVVGFKDWRNGNIVLEKYVRVEMLPNPTIRNLTSDFPREAVFGLEQYDRIFNNIFGTSNVPTWPPEAVEVEISPATLIPPEIDESECGPGVKIEPDGTRVPLDQGGESEEVEKIVGQYFKSIRYGLRLVCQSAQAPAPLAVAQHPISSVVGSIPNNEEKSDLNKSYHTSTVLPEELGTNSLDVFAFPLACVEQEVPLDTPMDSILNTHTGVPYFESHYPRNTLKRQLKELEEYKFIFDYCFPIKRLVSLAALYNITYLLPLPGINDVFMNTKEQLRIPFFSFSESGNYQTRDCDWTNAGLNQNTANGILPPGFNFAEMALKFLFALLKGAGETFDPNIALAKKIQDSAKMIGGAVVDVANTAKKTGNRLSDMFESDEEVDGATGPCADGGRRRENEPDEDDEINICDLPDWMRAPEIPISLISLGLFPLNIFPPIPMGPGWGPPITPLGMAYLTWFHSKRARGRLILDSGKEKEKDRCDEAEKAGGLQLTNPQGSCAEPKDPEED